MDQMKQIDKLCELIRTKKPQIVFLNGAGISTSCGIPDFRSPGTGLYDNLAKLNLPFAELVFDIDFFAENPKPFYVLAKDIYPGQYKPSKYHYFIRACQDKKLLKRCYTQNIDTLERLTGVHDDKIIEAHGSFSGNHCIECHEPMSIDVMAGHIERQEILKCSKCESYVKPDIVFFGEALPEKFWTKWDEDQSDIDLLIVCGTSLSVYPFAGLPQEVGKKTVRVLINNEKVGDFKEHPRGSDIVILGDIEEIVSTIIEKLEWSAEFTDLVDTHDELFKANKLKLKLDQMVNDVERALEEPEETALISLEDEGTTKTEDAELKKDSEEKKEIEAGESKLDGSAPEEVEKLESDLKDLKLN